MSNSSDLVVQENLTEQDLAELIASTEDGARVTNAQLVDVDGNVLTVSMEDLSAAGIDVDNVSSLSEEQLAHLLGGSTAVAGDKHETDSTPRDADSITMVIGEDGSLKLTDADHHQFFFTAEQLACHAIDVNNLSDEQIQRVVQLAMPSLDLCKTSADTSRKRARPGQGQGDTASTSRLPFDHNMTGTDHFGPHSSSPGKTGARSGQFSLIGQEVEVRKNGRSFPATIRYCRHGAGYKVQFADGHFEWVSDQQIQLRRIKVTSQTPDDKDCEANFCCPICDRRVYQREPAYIVIRLPACDACTESKILVLDQDDPPSSS